MAKKTVSIVKDVTPVAPQAGGSVADQLKIDELELLRLTRASEKGRAAQLELQLASNALNGLFQKWLSETEDAKKLNARILELQAEAKKAQDTYQEIVLRVSSDLKIDMNKYAYDDETGVLSPLPESPAAPAQP